jgi:hypothetical protein
MFFVLKSRRFICLLFVAIIVVIADGAILVVGFFI